MLATSVFGHFSVVNLFNSHYAAVCGHLNMNNIHLNELIRYRLLALSAGSDQQS